ncbi:MAG: DUF480 domain-containing protein [Phycisphaerales bacterium]|nr:DUF480 domain-containing protein [Phycisphaerales bacterium]
MVTLSEDESRVLGVLVEKAQTVPGQYPMTLNSVVLGCNQKNNRDPVTSLTEERVYDAIDRLKAKGLVREAFLSGSRVAKYRHLAREVLNVGTEELVLLTELLLRGPQSAGELRGRASRMHPLETLEAAQGFLAGLRSRSEPMVRELPARPGERATRWVQLLSPDLHPVDAGAAAAPARESAAGQRESSDLEARIDSLEQEIESLRAEVTALGEQVQRVSG